MKLCKKTKNFGKQNAAARNDVIAKKIASGLFQNRSGRPEDWTVSGLCHLQQLAILVKYHGAFPGSVSFL